MLETIIGFVNSLTTKVGVLIAGLTTAAVVATPTALPVTSATPSVQTLGTSTTCTVTVNGETQTYTYESSDSSQAVVCGSQNGQSFSKKVDTGALMQQIDGEVGNIKDALKSSLSGLGL